MTHPPALAKWVKGPMGARPQVPSVERMNLPLIAGSVSTLLFATSMLPMLVKAVRTKDLSSYSFSYLAMTNVANLVHSVYVFNLPLGPIWLLHGFYLTASVLMLVWFVRFRAPRTVASAPAPTVVVAEAPLPA